MPFMVEWEEITEISVVPKRWKYKNRKGMPGDFACHGGMRR
ncbi:hypothetical protein CLV97_12719 [Planifilum fimeticola]|uniref:Uncharacterized protein n=1 Tax=Planifilum fimeticola TaxID=201975 RepID=A0A2T0LBJ8_9BACL|nr:hypothetical protein CLV97_12719 [Planifilum fimeticola]